MTFNLIEVILAGLFVTIILIILIMAYSKRNPRTRKKEQAPAAPKQATPSVEVKPSLLENPGQLLPTIPAKDIAAKRAQMAAVAEEQAAKEKDALEQAIAEWAAVEQAESERVQLQRYKEERWEAEQLDARMQAVERAIEDWLQAEQEGSQVPVVTGADKHLVRVPGVKYTRTEAISQQVVLTAEKVAKEVADLDYIKNRIAAGVDFLPIEFKLTVDEWKKGAILRDSTFHDLKLKFRYKAYSIEDGYELLALYNDWLAQQRQKLRVFIRLLGTDPDPMESIQSALERAEAREREKYLEMDVDVIFTLREIWSILEKLMSMETILKELEVVCRKRSEQIITPPWEAKSSL
ncbi:MAG: hypothetical protein ABTQ25_10430 [Nitrosomonas ureae]